MMLISTPGTSESQMTQPGKTKISERSMTKGAKQIVPIN